MIRIYIINNTYFLKETRYRWYWGILYTNSNYTISRVKSFLRKIFEILFLEEIIAVQDEDISTISISNRNLSNLRFADDIDLIAGSKDELQTLTNKLSNSASRYGMQISAEKSKLMINSNVRNIHSNIKLYGEKLEEQFKYSDATITKDGSSDSEIKIRFQSGIANISISSSNIIYIDL